MQPTEKMQLIAGGPGTAPSFVWLGSYMTALKGHGFSTEWEAIVIIIIVISNNNDNNDNNDNNNNSRKWKWRDPESVSQFFFQLA